MQAKMTSLILEIFMSNELSFCLNLKFSNPYNFATWWWCCIRIVDRTKFKVWLHQQVAEILGLQNVTKMDNFNTVYKYVMLSKKNIICDIRNSFLQKKSYLHF